jgi:2-phospho-L-lactate/phosphoenolpyruvate guanylyltransferase
VSIRACWALLPVKPLGLAKSRLEGALSAEARRDLASSLLVRTLDVLSRTAGLSGIAVVSRDPEVAKLALGRGALPLGETSSRLDEIVDGALAELLGRGAAAALVVLSDLPSLRADDLVAMISLGARHEVVLAPDERDEGTNAMLLRPPDRMRTCFGRRGSFDAHRGRAESMGIDVAVLRAPGVAFDLDTVGDLHRL